MSETPESPKLAPEKQPDKQPEFEFESVYANNTSLEISAFDLKIFFGQIEQHTGKTLVDWHTAVTLPWAQAKILSYFLQAQIAWYERIFIPILIPPGAKPPKPEPVEDGNPIVMEYYTLIRKLHDDIFGAEGEQGPTSVTVSPSEG